MAPYSHWTVLGVVGMLAACGDAKSQNASPQVATTSSTAVSSAARASATASSMAPSNASAKPTVSAAPSSSGASEEQLDPERANVGCKLRKNTNVISACAAAPSSSKPSKLGAWSPSEDDVAAVVAHADACYCADGAEAAVRSCMKQAKTSLVTFTLGKEGDPTDCAVTVSSADSKGRHFVRLDAVNRDLATFYTTIAIDDFVAGAPKSYLSAFNLVEASEIESGATGVSRELKSQWAKLPAPLQNWILAR